MWPDYLTAAKAVSGSVFRGLIGNDAEGGLSPWMLGRPMSTCHRSESVNCRGNGIRTVPHYSAIAEAT